MRTALNIVCFPEQMDLNILGRILQGGSEKVIEAGGSLAGGHSIADSEVKYGLSVTGTIHPDRIRANNTGHVGDALVLTKPLGVGLTCTAARMGCLLYTSQRPTRWAQTSPTRFPMSLTAMQRRLYCSTRTARWKRLSQRMTLAVRSTPTPAKVRLRAALS